MGFKFASFGAATVPLSKVIIDKDLDMRPYGITAAFARVPYRATEWETEELEWGDVPASPAVYLGYDARLSTGDIEVLMSWTTPAGATYRWTVKLISASDSGGTAYITIKVDGVEFDTFQVNKGATVNRNLHLPPDAAVTVTGSNPQGSQILIKSTSYYQFTGMVVGPKTFDLTGKWLALGIDMKGLATTVKIHSVEVPYSDYAKYFPLAPTELKIPGDWEPTQERPVIKVYKVA